MTAASLSPTSADEIDRTYRKVAWRIIPLLMVCYVLAFIDRGNVGFAKLQFMGELGFNEAVYGLGGGLFYLGYSIFEIPSNLLLARVGVRLTLLRIMVIWGLCSAALAFMTAPSHYYILRTLLGVAEAGFFPGILYYITTWIPASRRGRFTAYFMSAIAISGILSGPLSGLIMHTLDGVLGLKGWQWLFLVEGLPSAAMGVVAYYALPDSPRSARWLTPREMTIITTELEGEQKAKQGHGAGSFREALADKRLYVILGMSVGLLACGAGIPLWLPTILRKAGVTDVFELGLMAAVPSIVGVIVQQLNARHSDRTQERRWHAAIPALFCALGWLLLPFTMDNAWLSLAILSVMMAGFLGATGPYWTLPALYLSGPAAAGGIALITTVGGIGAFFVPTLVGWLTAETGSLSAGLVFYGVVMTVGVAIMLAGTRAQPKRLVPASASA